MKDSTIKHDNELFTERDVQEIALQFNNGMPLSMIAVMKNTTTTSISQISLGKTYKRYHSLFVSKSERNKAKKEYEPEIVICGHGILRRPNGTNENLEEIGNLLRQMTNEKMKYR